MSEFSCGYKNYNAYPTKNISNKIDAVFEGNQNVFNHIKHLVSIGKRKIIIDLYPGVDKHKIISELNSLKIGAVLDVEDARLSSKELHSVFDDNVTDDRVFGVKTYKTLSNCFDISKIAVLKEHIEKASNTLFVVGTGAGLLGYGDCYIYINLARREIQERYENGMSNWLWDTSPLPSLAKSKQAYFVEWILADKHKDDVYSNIDYMIDANKEENLKMLSGEDLHKGLKAFSNSPFRLKPFFASGIWGGNWMKEVLQIETNEDNLAWCFDGVPEENSILMKYGSTVVEIPALDLILKYPYAVLGDKVYGRYGKEFPIRFNMLDLMGGGNLSLQVHPVTEYVQNTFGAHYTQDESYYILDAKEDSSVYLGIKNGVDPEEFKDNLLASESGTLPFNTAKFTNKFPIKRHDHVSIPAGTIHSAGKNTMILEISATPNIYTFKLWDWGRIDKNGIPRPIHTTHGLNNIQWERDTTWLKENILPKEEQILSSDALNVFRTGLHAREALETHKIIFTDKFSDHTYGNLIVFNLVEGKAVEITSPTNAFESFEVHYAETFIVPASVGEFNISPKSDANTKCILIKAFIR